MDLSVELAQRIDHIECVSLKEIFTSGDADPFVKLVEYCVVKVLSF